MNEAPDELVLAADRFSLHFPRVRAVLVAHALPLQLLGVRCLPVGEDLFLMLQLELL